MPPKRPKENHGTNVAKGTKRKEPPSSDTALSKANTSSRAPKRAKIQDARTILTQNADAALSNGELDLNAFLKAREFEIKALEDGMSRAKNALTTRAFQQVPREMRRRTASHNVKKVPKRLQKRAAREMKDDNTPTVMTSKRRPATSRGRLRAETAKRLGLLAGKKRGIKTGAQTKTTEEKEKYKGIETRVAKPKARKGSLNVPPKPPSKFRRRQIHKTWLPTHIYHAKRAKMTEPTKPLWRFAVPITPTEKCYRPTHRAAGARGALCWDMSYISSIGLEGSDGSIEKVLRLMGITQDDAWGRRGQKWRDGKRVWSGWLSRDNKCQRSHIGPATMIWCAPKPSQSDTNWKEDNKIKKSTKPPRRKLMIQIHPSAFLELWDELLRVSKMQRPVVHCEDLRFEIGSIGLTGPGCTEALVGILHQFEKTSVAVTRDHGKEPMGDHGKLFKDLASVNNSASLPANVLLGFSIMDPRLRYPPRKLHLPKPDDGEATLKLLEILSTWPADHLQPSLQLFDRDIRHAASHLSSQKSLNRRKAAAVPGEYAPCLPSDPSIPIILYTSSASTNGLNQGNWTLLAPWRCILPIWYGLMHYPLSSGGNPRFGGLQELQQISFEHGKPWFPGDFPGTGAGWTWEIEERIKRKKEWEARPKGKRIQFESLDLGAGRKGEVGLGWACDFEWFLEKVDADEGTKDNEIETEKDQNKVAPILTPVQHLPSATFRSILSEKTLTIPATSVATVRITLFSHGVPKPCARIYRLPQPAKSILENPDNKAPPPASTSNNLSKSPASAPPSTFTTKSILPDLRTHWLSLAPSTTKNPKTNKHTTKPHSSILNLPPAAQRRALAQSLLPVTPLSYPAEKAASHPVVPGAEDLIGFVTTGGFNLAKGVGTAIGSLYVRRVIDGLKGNIKGRQERMCIIRNAGESIGRLGIWELV